MRSPEIATSAKEVLITLRQNKRAFVEKVDFVTSAGHLDGGDAGVHALADADDGVVRAPLGEGRRHIELEESEDGEQADGFAHGVWFSVTGAAGAGPTSSG